MIKPKAIKEPYPTIENMKDDKHSATVLSPECLGKNGELNALLFCIYAEIYCEKLGDNNSSEIFEKIAIDELQHLKLLGKATLSLGENSNFVLNLTHKFSNDSSQTITLSNCPKKILTDAITAKLMAINFYEKLLTDLKNNQVYELIESILIDEREHLKILSDRLESCGVRIFC